MGCIWSSDRIWANITVSFFTFSWCEATTQQELCHCYILNTGLIPLKCNAVYLFSVNDEIKQMKGTVHPKIKFRYFSSCLYIAAYPPRLFWVPSFVDTGLRYICLLSNIIKPDGTQLEALKAAQKKKSKIHLEKSTSTLLIIPRTCEQFHVGTVILSAKPHCAAGQKETTVKDKGLVLLTERDVIIIGVNLGWAVMLAYLA